MMTDKEWQDEMSEYDLDVPTRNAIEKFRPYMNSDIKYVASETDMAVADLIVYDLCRVWFT